MISDKPTESPKAVPHPRDWRVGDRVRGIDDDAVYTITARKADDSGWWLDGRIDFGIADTYAAKNIVRLGPETTPSAPGTSASATGSAKPESPPSKASALCQHCHQPIYEGLLTRTCPSGHDLTKAAAAAEPEPDAVVERWSSWLHPDDGKPDCDGDHYLFDKPCPGAERVWLAMGRGTSNDRTHPTREGAIAAWREAVKRG